MGPLEEMPLFVLLASHGSQMCRVSDLKLEASRQPALAAHIRPPGQTSRKRAGLGANKRRAGPKGA